MSDFDYSGSTQQEIEALCSEENVLNYKCKFTHWFSRVYSNYGPIRKYGYFPEFLRCNVSIEHSVPGVYDEELSPVNVNHSAYCNLYFAKHSLELFKKDYPKEKVYPIVSPMVLYRQQENINRSETAKGTLYFLSHSGDKYLNFEDYFEKLKSLPEKYKPVCVCMSYEDIDKGNKHIPFLEAGIPVYTAGNVWDIRFGERFYNLIKNFKYTMGNDTGSYTYYSVEMGIPFSTYGLRDQYEAPDKIVEGGITIDMLHPDFVNRYNLFTGKPRDQITPEQLEITRDETGLSGKSISRLKMAQILYTAYFVHKFWSWPKKVIKFIRKVRQK